MHNFDHRRINLRDKGGGLDPSAYSLFTFASSSISPITLSTSSRHGFDHNFLRKHASHLQFNRQFVRMRLATICSYLLLIWCSASISSVSAQYKPRWPSPVVQREIFVLNLEDGYFGCQVNESTDFLQLFELSKLCDGHPHCFQGSDELAVELKCTDRNQCHPSHPRCANGVCLDNLCYCNDGFGGKGCDLPDENECKYRPCDVFAHCTNTLGSFYCSCYPGYDGDGFICHDVNECDDPSLTSYCAENAECCNLPGHFVCKCKSGFTGNATQLCTDIDECATSDSCGRGAECENKVGSHDCRCPSGYTGDAFTECWDIDECKDSPCATGASCQNLPGSFECSCPAGYRSQQSPEAGCFDIDECEEARTSNQTICGVDANCVNTPGSHFCQCPTGYTGNPRSQCTDVNECPDSCGQNSACKNLPGSFQCKCLDGYEGDAYSMPGCLDINECEFGSCGVNAVCKNTIGSFECACSPGFTGDPHVGCHDINECLLGACGPGALCNNSIGSYECLCPDKYIARGTPELGCERSAVDVSCSSDNDCTENAFCEKSVCRCKRGFVSDGALCVDLNECAESLHIPDHVCGLNATCINTHGSYQCKCSAGFQHSVSDDLSSRCQDVNECMDNKYPCGINANCVNDIGSFRCLCREGFVGDPIVGCKSPCEQINCGSHAKCRVADDGQPVCACDFGYQLNTIMASNSTQITCIDIDECDSTFGPSGLCGQGAICTNKNGGHHCYCPPGFTGDPFRQCSDIDECNFKYGPFGRCGVNALCENTLGGFRCNCPKGFEGDARVRCFDVDECDRRFGDNSRCGFGAICMNSPGTYTCRCPPGTTGDARHKCSPVQTCQSDNQCQGNARCIQNHCRCSAPFIGESCKHPCELMNCGDRAQCELNSQDQPICVCASGFTGNADSLIGCVDIDECTSSNTTVGICGKNASCRNLAGTYDCVCPIGTTSLSTGGCVFPDGISTTCQDDSSCGRNEQCMTFSNDKKYCTCRFGYKRDNANALCRDINECVESNSPVCGTNAFCSNSEGAYVCSCPVGYTGNPNSICYPDVLRCSSHQDCPGNLRCLTSDSNNRQCGCDAPYVREGDYCVFTSHNCSASNRLCPSNQHCELDGQSESGFCICPAGFTLEANGNCRDINECVELSDFDLCGAHALCRNRIGSFDCECEPGYQGNPKAGCSRTYHECEIDNQCPANHHCRAGFCECLPPFVFDNNTCHNPCDFYRCGSNAECILSPNGLPSCRCRMGCAGDPNKACEDINECLEYFPTDPNGPCSIGAVCFNTFGSYRCECRSGLLGDPYQLGCSEHFSTNGSISNAFECRTDNSNCPSDARCDSQSGLCIDACHGFECPKNSICVASDHMPSCTCAPGFQTSKNRKLSFTEDCVSDCDSITCASNAQCIIDQSSKAVCHCPAGTTGNPWAGGDGCKEAHNCTALYRCPDGMVCGAHAQCVHRCDEKTCGGNALCNSLTKQCECPPHYRGDPYMLCAPPIPYSPLCDPACGKNSHCSYDLPFNKCVCNAGFSGNPYEKCERLTRCDRTRCGRAAHCVEKADSSVGCVCDAGYFGNPYIGCQDTNECLQGQVCGYNASCINLIGSYRCICLPGTTGNPLYACQPPTSARPFEMHDLMEIRNRTAPGKEVPSQPRPVLEESTDDRDSIDLDDDRCTTVCKPPLVCYRGACGSRNACQHPTDCDDESSCITVNERVGKQCVDPCDTVQCGPNAACTTKEHIPSCHCNVSYVGNPDDLVFGCAPGDAAARQPSICDMDDDCDSGFVCRSLSSPSNSLEFKNTVIKNSESTSAQFNNRQCLPACVDLQCGPNAKCELSPAQRPQCICKSGHAGDAYDIRRGCRAHVCSSDSNCAESQSCVASPDGVRECRDSCEHEQPICGRNALCRTHAHRAICDCRPGFVGDPLDLMVGCQPAPTSTSTFNVCTRDTDCLIEAACFVQSNGIRNCSSVCDRWRCALNARCIARDHRPTCECLPGYVGEKPQTEPCQMAVYDLCKSDNDCEDDKNCRPIGNNGRFDCVPVCDHPPENCMESGRQCIGRNHRAHCECAATHILLQNRCESHLCDRDSHCGHGHVCRVTKSGKRDCIDPCEDLTCGSNAICTLTANNRPTCQCRAGYTGDATDERRGCLPLDECVLDVHCSETAACRLTAEGIKRCVDPCREAEQPCGPNALCKVVDHVPQCECFANHFGRPDQPQVGCRPITNECESDAECPFGSKCQSQNGGGRLCVHLCDRHVCGENAVCVSGQGKQPTCICRTGFNGNPLVACKPYQCRHDTDCPHDTVCALDVNGNHRCAPVCALVTCAKDAACLSSHHRAQCMCPIGFEGNPYNYTQQVLASLNTAADVDDVNRPSPLFDLEHMVQTLKANLRPTTGCRPVASHKCMQDADCATDAKCERLKSDQFDCVPVCRNVRCGPNSECIVNGDHSGGCQCLEGFAENSSTSGCQPVHHECSISEDCANDTLICKPDSYQNRRVCASVCADESACQRNQICVPGNYTYRCDCEAAYEMDRQTGICRRPDHDCESDDQCSAEASCRIDASGARRCLQSCDFYACPSNARCHSFSHRARCECEPGFTGDPQSRDGCSRIPTHQCETNEDCAFDQECTSKPIPTLNTHNSMSTYAVSSSFGSRRCVSACLNMNCGAHAVCMVDANRQPVCKCPGKHYVGDPYDLSIGCKRVECTVDADCPNNRACSEQNFCFDPCISSCTSNTVCVVQSHLAHCSCAPGFFGDPYVAGCKRHIGCQKCHPSALCLPNNANSAFTDSGSADPLPSSNPMSTAFSRNGNVFTSTIDDFAFGELCVCPPEYIGNAYNKSGPGCLPTVDCPKGNDQCPGEAACLHDASGVARCADPCQRTHCGPNSRCVVRNHLAHCQCAPTFVLFKTGTECIRQARKCTVDNECGSSSACVAGQCRIVCSRDPDCAHGERCADHLCVRPCLSHEACESFEACVQPGFCQIGCRTSDNCGNDQVCIRNHCVDPCKLSAIEAIAWDKSVSRFRFNSSRDVTDESTTDAKAISDRKINVTSNDSISGVCGPNSQCLVQSHRLTCTCLNGFEPDPTPYIGCRRQLRICSIEAGLDCTPGLMCRSGRCRPRCSKHIDCAQGESCVNGWCMAGCFNDGSCASGELCVGQLCIPGCRSDTDCSADQRCDVARKCVCRSGFRASHDGKCVDIDECNEFQGQSPCGEKAKCVNVPGSFKCICSDGRPAEARTNCESLGQCPNGDADCPEDTVCISDSNHATRCIDPCTESTKNANVTTKLKSSGLGCGPNALCQVVRHRMKCTCSTDSDNGLHFTGNPYDLTTGCRAVDCIKDEHCATDRQCINFVCEGACDSVDCGPHGSCIIVREREPACRCETGFENNGRLTCADIDECRTQRPCHESAICVNVLGSYNCRCPVGLIGDPYASPGCFQPDACPNGDRDCPDAASCVQVQGKPRCRDRCHDPTACGRNATCVTINHVHQCSCPPGTTGNAKLRCESLQCERSLDCINDSDVCVGNKCVPVCSTHTSCGVNAECVSQIHSYTCRCKDGYYGDPVVGCRRRLKCDNASECPLGQSCAPDRHCAISCRTLRDCLPSERCDDRLCSFVCQSSTDCAPGQLCVAGRCHDPSIVVENRCLSDSDCGSEFACRAIDSNSEILDNVLLGNTTAVARCTNVCEGILCGRNADCAMKDHKPVCECRSGHFGNAYDERVGCQRGECEHSFDCGFDKVCQNHQCISACLAVGSALKCATNAACVAIDHRAECRCAAGYTGDAYQSCKTIDYCRMPNACHPTAICRNTLQGAVCECPPSQNIGSPYEDPGCRAPNSCPNGNSDCPANAVCANGMCRNPCEKTFCGPNAFCRVENRAPVCSCRSGFIGLAHDREKGCTRTLQQCSSFSTPVDTVNRTEVTNNVGYLSTSSQCHTGQACVHGICRQICSAHSQCGENERCVKKVCSQRCDSDAGCSLMPGQICNQGVCTIGCRSDMSCSTHEACLMNRCVPLCHPGTACAANAVCHAIGHRKRCSCLAGFGGNPKEDGICRRTQNLCISNADCGGINQSCIDDRCMQHCSMDSECAFGEKCEQNKCIQLCGSSAISLRTTLDDQHCPPGNICSAGRCIVGCRQNAMCAPHLACVSQRCQDPCAEPGACGPNSRCLVLEHRAHCVCPPGFVGRPTANVACVRVMPRCESDTDCSIASAISLSSSTESLSSTGLSGYHSAAVDTKIASANVSSLCVDGRCLSACAATVDCAINERCDAGKCVGACARDRDCASGEICQHQRCHIGCRSDEQCALTDRCDQNRCVHVCSDRNGCGTNALCRAIHHRKQCQCTVGTAGNAEVECIRQSRLCTADSQCSRNERCDGSVCKQRCASNSDCLDNERCESSLCELVCKHNRHCPNGFLCLSGSCVAGCSSDTDCSSSERCIAGQCRPACSTTSCGLNALCIPTNHQTVCRCPSGFSGQPKSECRPIQCVADNQCDAGQICQQMRCMEGCRNNAACAHLSNHLCARSTCVPGCGFSNVCGRNSLCAVKDNQPECRCPIGWSGNPYIECTTLDLSRVMPATNRTDDSGSATMYGCRSDLDCDLGFECFHEILSNTSADLHTTSLRQDTIGVCKLREKCISDGDCVEGNIVSSRWCSGGRCLSGCRADSHCPLDQRCDMLQASCVPVCDFRAACGKNAVCRPGANHRSICSCPTGYAGNSLISCEPLPRCVVHSDCADGQKCHAGRCTSAPARCVSDSECSDFEVCLTGQCKFGCRTSGQCAYDESCVNNVCLNACELTLCTLNARCLSIAHQPQCICLPGYEGDGRHSCLPKRVFCQSNAHCSSGQICVGNVCVSGCGNDSHCNHDQRCESGRCSALCTEKTCGFGGYCESSNHSSSCKCPAGWEGDPYIHCTQRNQTTIDLPSIIQTNISTSTEATSVSLPPTDVSEPSIVDCRDDAQCNVGSICEGNHCRAGCRLDAHCTYDSACVHGRCKLVCSLDSVCGRNGMCQPLMHRARCHCPPGTSGDPYDYCESFSIDPTRPPTFVPDPSNATKNISTGRHQQCTSQVHCLSGSFCSSDGHCIAGCESDHHCPANLACIRRTCSDPCASACATNAQCNLSANRQPICSCLPGFTGDASRQCTALRLSVCQSDLDCGIAQICEQKRCVEACRTDDTCSTGNSCINRRCQNPCAVYGVCGPSTTCLARDHQPHCECLHGFAGNPQIGCEPLIIPTQPSRNRTDDIPLDQKVPMVPTRPDVSSRTQLATNRTDRPVLSTVICSSDEACGFGRICRDAICVTGCRFHHQCAPHKQCHGGQCKNPCNENSCAVNAFCVASNHQAHCTCRPGFVGDGRRECRPFVAAGRSCAHARQCGGHALCSNGACRSGCTDDDQCNPEQACIHGTCQSPCAVANVCGRKALCTERNHTAVCECPDGYRGNANRLCTRAPPECTVDDECRIGQVCESSQCVSGCRGDHNCPVDQACLAGGKCGDPCRQSNACGSNSRCIVHRHRVRCECQPGFVGDPFASCVLPATDICENDLQCGLGQVCTRNRCVVGCTNDAGCRFEHSCINGQCRNPCEIFGACGVNAICTPQEHDRVCSCPPDWSGDARLMCEPFITPSSCRSDHECPTGHLCYVSHLNLESNMTASTWATGRCVLGCHNSNSCPPDRHCRNGLCEDPCSASGICGRHAICSVIEHEPVCSCPAGMRGQQNRGGACVDATISVGDRNECDQDIDCGLERICLRGVCASGCRTHRGCSLDKACVNGECQSPCTLGGMCGVNSICRSVGHQAQCTCAPGYTGDPLKQCSRAHVQCETASDCGRGHVCVKGQCKDINECLQERLPCGPGASCTNEPGWYRCQCPPPLVGNPYDLNTGCRQPKPLCLIDKDCQSNQKCNPVTKECYDLCALPGICGKGAKCKVSNGKPECECLPGHRGNPYTECAIRDSCNNHRDCPGNQLCEGQFCDCPFPYLTHGSFCVLPSVNCTPLSVSGDQSLSDLDCPQKQHCEMIQESIVFPSANTSTVQIKSPKGFCTCPKGFLMTLDGKCSDVNECELKVFPCAFGAKCLNTAGGYMCSCPPGTLGDAEIGGCTPAPLQKSCKISQNCNDDSECIGGICVNPCSRPNACGVNAVCMTSNHTKKCACRAGFEGDSELFCHKIVDCVTSNSCPGNLRCLNQKCACSQKEQRILDYCIVTGKPPVCGSTLPCSSNEQCVYLHKQQGICVCPRGFERKNNGLCVDTNECEQQSNVCATYAGCHNTNGSFYCACLSGYEGDPYRDGCKSITIDSIDLKKPTGVEKFDATLSNCTTDIQCAFGWRCNQRSNRCVDPCSESAGHLQLKCAQNAFCVHVAERQAICECAPGFDGDAYTQCHSIHFCTESHHCPGNLRCNERGRCTCLPDTKRLGDYCLHAQSSNCTSSQPCSKNEQCIYTGTSSGFCVCPHGHLLSPTGQCHPIRMCAIGSPCANGAICQDIRGGYECHCPAESIGDPYVKGCQPITGCQNDNECPSDNRCDAASRQCVSPCDSCGPHAECSAFDHRAVCICPKGWVGEPFNIQLGCFQPPPLTINDTQDNGSGPAMSPGGDGSISAVDNGPSGDPSTERTIPPVAHLNVLCQSDGVQVGVRLGGYDGIVYVKGHSQDVACRRTVRADQNEVIDFKVNFGTCGLNHRDGEAGFILVVQKHPKLVTYRARAYHIKCVYNTGERVLTFGFNVSMITTSGTIANTGPPPTCSLSICTLDGHEVNSAEIGDDLLLRVNVQPDYIYGGFARSCIAKTIEEDGEYQYEVTDENGCATDPSIFGHWEYDATRKSLVARFNAFKFPSSNNLRFQCNVRVCFGSCPPAECNESEQPSFGRRRRKRRQTHLIDHSTNSAKYEETSGESNDSPALIDSYQEGALREEIQVQSNAILTFERRDSNSHDASYERARLTELDDHVCLPKIGLILSMIVTSLAALVAVAVAISCWLMAYRRRPLSLSSASAISSGSAYSQTDPLRSSASPHSQDLLRLRLATTSSRSTHDHHLSNQHLSASSASLSHVSPESYRHTNHQVLFESHSSIPFSLHHTQNQESKNLKFESSSGLYDRSFVRPKPREPEPDYFN